MERRTVREPRTGRCRIHINNGGRGPWCSFDYTSRHDPSVETVKVLIGEIADEETTRWFPDVRQGIALGWQRLHDHYGINLTGVVITIAKVYSHPIDTTSRGCELYGSLFIEGFGRDESSCVLPDGGPSSDS
ncbi:hypothetical protein [Paludisphaera rhizosphaerae]|uniref:hypothetical protein n=1 Tax=Paludisphaera rhizosphaerae TaxID=2711216 RepID=UPI0013ED4519|nr:hypothetical protein [Paludisphaera rhizosphaerae]